jgi:hypothetical protein
MSPIFGRKDEEKPDAAPVWTRQVLEAELDRLGALSLPLLATEVMTAGFGPGSDYKDDQVWICGPPSHWGRRPGEIADAMLAAKGFSSPLGYTVFATQQSSADNDLQQRIVCLIAEALQVLEHALLIRAQANQDHGFDYAITRRGRAALDGGAIEGILTATTT